MGYNANEIYQGSSDNLKAADIGDQMLTYTIASVDLKKFDKGDQKLILSFHEIDKTMVLNKTNSDFLSDLFTPDTDMWFGKQVMLFTIPTEYQGNKTMGLRLRSPAPAAQNNQFQGNQNQQNNNAGYSENPNPNG